MCPYFGNTSLPLNRGFFFLRRQVVFPDSDKVILVIQKKYVAWSLAIWTLEVKKTEDNKNICGSIILPGSLLEVQWHPTPPTFNKLRLNQVTVLVEISRSNIIFVTNKSEGLFIALLNYLT